MANLEAQAFSTHLAEQLKANDHPVSATYIARQIHVTPHAARLWLMGINIPKDQNLKSKWLKVDSRWLRYVEVLEDSFITNSMSLREENNASVKPELGTGH